MSVLPVDDARSHHILAQMEMDEAKHRDQALAAGAMELPMPVKLMMSWTSKVMVKTAYYV